MFCECGCGKLAPICPHTNKRRGYVKGQPLHFIKGHWVKTRTGETALRWQGGKVRNVNGYVQSVAHGHPRATPGGYVYEHVLIAEKAVGRFLAEPIQVHHVNLIRDDNRKSNLVVCEDEPYHKLLHARTRALKNCGNAHFRSCKYCHGWEAPELLYGSGENRYHSKCKNERGRARYKENHA